MEYKKDVYVGTFVMITIMGLSAITGWFYLNAMTQPYEGQGLKTAAEWYLK